MMDKIPAKFLDCATFTLIALVSLLFSFGDNMRVAMIVDHMVFYVACISAAVSLGIKRKRPHLPRVYRKTSVA